MYVYVCVCVCVSIDQMLYEVQQDVIPLHYKQCQQLQLLMDGIGIDLEPYIAGRRTSEDPFGR